MPELVKELSYDINKKLFLLDELMEEWLVRSDFQKDYQEKRGHKRISIGEWEGDVRKRKRVIQFRMGLDMMPAFIRKVLGLDSVSCWTDNYIEQVTSGQEYLYSTYIYLKKYEDYMDMEFIQTMKIIDGRLTIAIKVFSKFNKTIWGFTGRIDQQIFEEVKRSMDDWISMVDEYVSNYVGRLGKDIVPSLQMTGSESDGSEYHDAVEDTSIYISPNENLMKRLDNLEFQLSQVRKSDRQVLIQFEQHTQKITKLWIKADKTMKKQQNYQKLFLLFLLVGFLLGIITKTVTNRYKPVQRLWNYLKRMIL